MEVSDLHLIFKHTLILLDLIRLCCFDLDRHWNGRLLLERYIYLAQGSIFCSQHVFLDAELSLLDNLRGLNHRIRDILQCISINLSVHQYKNTVIVAAVFLQHDFLLLEVDELGLWDGLYDPVNLNYFINI